MMYITGVQVTCTRM